MQRKTLLVLGLSLLLSACDGQNAGAPTGAGGEQEVGVVTLRGRSVTLSSELTGRVNATMTSDVRPQVDGIIKQRLFTEGAEVKAGQVLYQIDPASYQASYDQAAAQLKNAQATVQSTRLKSQRYAALVKENGVSQQDADDAKAAYLAAVASVAQYQAALETARINLAYTQVRAPIAGRIGISSVTPGALVTASQTDALATIRALDPIYVDLTQSSAQLLKLRRQQAALQRGAVTPVAIKLEDGTPYAHAGKLELTEVAVDEATGSVTLRAVFPTPSMSCCPACTSTPRWITASIPKPFWRRSRASPATPKGSHRVGGGRAKQRGAAHRQRRTGGGQQLADRQRAERRRSPDRRRHRQGHDRRRGEAG